MALMFTSPPTTKVVHKHTPWYVHTWYIPVVHPETLPISFGSFVKNNDSHRLSNFSHHPRTRSQYRSTCLYMQIRPSKSQRLGTCMCAYHLSQHKSLSAAHFLRRHWYPRGRAALDMTERDAAESTNGILSAPSGDNVEHQQHPRAISCLCHVPCQRQTLDQERWPLQHQPHAPGLIMLG